MKTHNPRSYCILVVWAERSGAAMAGNELSCCIDDLITYRSAVKSRSSGTSELSASGTSGSADRAYSDNCPLLDIFLAGLCRFRLATPAGVRDIPNDHLRPLMHAGVRWFLAPVLQAAALPWTSLKTQSRLPSVKNQPGFAVALARWPRVSSR